MKIHFHLRRNIDEENDIVQAEALAAKESEEDDDDDDYSYNEIDPMLKKKLLQVNSFYFLFSQRYQIYAQEKVAPGNFLFSIFFFFYNEIVPMFK